MWFLTNRPMSHCRMMPPRLLRSLTPCNVSNRSPGFICRRTKAVGSVCDNKVDSPIRPLGDAQYAPTITTMAATKLPDEVRADHIAAMGDDLGQVYYALWQEVALLFRDWGAFIELFL